MLAALLLSAYERHNADHLQKIETAFGVSDTVTTERLISQNTINGNVEREFDWLRSELEPDWISALENIRAQSKRILDEQLFAHFTDHTSRHSDRVLGNIGNLVALNLNSAPRGKKLNAYELATLAVAAYLHDVGMQTPIFEQRRVKKEIIDNDMYAAVREKHAYYSSVMIENSISRDRGDYPTLGLDQHQTMEDITPFVKDICEHHSGNNIDLTKVDAIYTEEIRVGLLTAILRLADALDLNQQRVDLNKLKRLEIPIESQVHWWRHYYVQSVLIKDGLITVSMTFPNDFTPIYEDYFKNLVLREIQKELDLSQSILHSNHIFVLLENEIRVTHIPTSMKSGLPSALKNYIDEQLAERNESSSTIAERLKSIRVVQGTPMDWISYWGFKGNPWVDIPLPYRDEEFVVTSAISRILSEIASLQQVKRGELKLLVGERGSGKTTFFNAASGFAKEAGLRIRYVDILEGVVSLRNPADLYYYVMKQIFDCLSIDRTEEYSEKALRKLIMDYNLEKVMIGIDNLDLYSEDDDLKIIREFFKLSQSMLQLLKSKFVLVISCSPKWSELLRSSDLSYLGSRVSWELKAFSKVEAKELISKKLKMNLMDFSDVFSTDILSALVMITEGNPRRMVQILEEWCRLAAAKEVKKIDMHFLEQFKLQDLIKESRVLMRSIAGRSKYYGEALSRIYLFNQDMDRNRLQPDRGWDYLQKIAQGGLPVSDIDEQYSGSLSYAAMKFQTHDNATGKSETKWILRSMVRDFLESWSKEGATLDVFISAFRSDPVIPSTLSSDAFSMVDINKLQPDARKSYLAAKEGYESVMSTRMTPPRLIEYCWDVVCFLIEAIAIQFQVSDPIKLNDWKKKDELNRIRMTNEELIQLAWNYYTLLPDISRKVGWLQQRNEIFYILKSREKVLKTPPNKLSEYSEQDAELCKLALAQVYSELCNIFVQHM